MNLLEDLKGQMSEQLIGAIAKGVGIDSSKIHSVLGTVVPGILALLGNKSGDSAGAESVFSAIQDSDDGIDTRRITLQEVHFSGTYCYSRYDFAAALNLLARGIVQNRDWIEVRPLEQGAQSFMDIHEGNAPPKVILSMG